MSDVNGQTEVSSLPLTRVNLYALLVIAICLVLLGAIVESAIDSNRLSSSQSESHVNVAPRYSAIANFGVLPVNQPDEWLTMNEKAGNQVGTMPMEPGDVVLKSYREPQIQQPDYIGGAWTITFKN